MDNRMWKPILTEVLNPMPGRWIHAAAPAAELSKAAVAMAGPAGEAPAVDNPLDLRQIEALGGADFVAELLQVFYVEANASIRTMRAAGAEGSAGVVARVAHTLKGSSGAVGARRLVDICLQLEAVAQTQDLSPVPALLDELEAEMERARIFMESR